MSEAASLRLRISPVTQLPRLVTTPRCTHHVSTEINEKVNLKKSESSERTSNQNKNKSKSKSKSKSKNNSFSSRGAAFDIAAGGGDVTFLRTQRHHLYRPSNDVIPSAASAIVTRMLHTLGLQNRNDDAPKY